ncbi:unnamed protein product [Urochloa decumbens]|uniref:Uncharacterized protein n=1 Tax=Urochloa decumbens TaxID=240449 RepID=A0ABC8Y9U6_9POAL
MEAEAALPAWHALVDARGLLLRHVLPHALRGIFINYSDYEQPLFFVRPSSEFPPVSGDLGYVPGFGPHYGTFIDHCNGLLLYPGDSGYYVINPATRQWESFSYPRVDGHGRHATCLVFDPAVSPHYEVFCIPLLPRPDERGVRQEHVPPTSSSFNLGRLFSSDDDDTVAMEAVEEEQRVLDELARPDDPYGSMEWPQSLCTLHVFSSSTRRWEGDPVGTVEGARRWPQYDSRYRVYWQGTRTIPTLSWWFPDEVLLRFSLKLGKYRAIKTPEDIEEIFARFYLGRSIGGVYLAIMCGHQLRIWNLNDQLSGEAEWVLKHRVDLDRSALWAAARLSKRDSVTRGPWMLMYSDSETSVDGGEDSGSEMYADTGEDSGNEEVTDSEISADGGEDNGSETYADTDTGDDRDSEEVSDSEASADGGEDSGSEVLLEEYFEWNSDDECIVHYEDGNVDDEDIAIYILGFHPYKEVVFLMVSFVAVAYNLSTSKVQFLGKSLPRDYNTRAKRVDEAFPYTPCMIGDLLNNDDYETSSEDWFLC